MTTFIPDPQLQTWIFEIVLIIALLLSIQRVKKHHILDPDQTDELKGFAILAVIFSHIGLFLFTDQKFLEPLSHLPGVGVNLFLLLSGFGLMLSADKLPLNPFSFYQKRLLRIFLPLWITLIIFFLLDWLWLGLTYSPTYIIQSFLGFFPTADVWQDVNSPLWYFTLILYFYLLFPWLTFNNLKYLAPIVYVFISRWVLSHKLPVQEAVNILYHLHYLAFPIGLALALGKRHLPVNQIKTPHILQIVGSIAAAAVIGYLTLHSNVGVSLSREQFFSLLTVGFAIVLFWLLPVRFRLLTIFGQYSYELYLIHWPIMSRYTHLYKIMPAALATILYLILLLGLAYLLQRLVKLIR